MLKIKSLLGIVLTFTCSVLITSCSEDNNDLDDVAEIPQSSVISTQSSASVSASSPFSFSDVFEGDDFQVDPVDNGFDIRDFFCTFKVHVYVTFNISTC